MGADLPQAPQAVWRTRRQRAYEQPIYDAAKAALLRLRQDLRPLNESAVGRLDDGLEDTLTLHRLGVVERLAVNFTTTNVLESVMAQVEQRTGKVDDWKTSDQQQHWLTTALLDIEPRLRRVKGDRFLPQLRVALQLTIAKEVTAA